MDTTIEKWILQCSKSKFMGFIRCILLEAFSRVVVLLILRMVGIELQ